MIISNVDRLLDGARKFLTSAPAIDHSYSKTIWGSVRATTNGGGTISAQYSYDAWGTPTGSAGSYGFTGEPQTTAGGGAALPARAGSALTVAALCVKNGWIDIFRRFKDLNSVAPDGSQVPPACSETPP